ncbi:MAG: tRNA (adenosine(37)-N6)-threonylcarbamoyltransferase complex transferase subunit TsaD [Nannocystaceae bacterium]|nr:tRNA (adenosine(37)-N6)-threonylcarbamoyltransferase complex transferase subunit TsaD [Nannocystaceae bacterium]
MSAPPEPTILALESSCDETAAAVVRGTRVLSSIVSTQIEIHRQFGGVVPELASRHHLGSITTVTEQAISAAGMSLEDIDAIAVTEGPGLSGALLVAVQMGRGLSFSTGKPLYGVHHMEGHLWSAYLGDAELEPATFAPHVAMLVSGGHTELVEVRAVGRYRVLGCTRDDAAGEAYDKVGKLLGLGYPGGPVIDKLAAEGNPAAHAFPRPMLKQPGFEFSFAGLKTAVLVHVERRGAPDSRQALADICASFQAAVSDILVAKAARALERTGLKRLNIVGGVAANRGLRETAMARGATDGFEVRVPPLRYCGDNAAMIGAAAAARVQAGVVPGVDVYTNLPIDDDRVLFA